MLRLTQEKYAKRPRKNFQRSFDFTDVRRATTILGPFRRKIDSVKRFAVKEKKSEKLELKELNPDDITYFLKNPLASGASDNVGQCWIEVVVKKMICKDASDKSRAIRNLIHEAEVLTALCDHERLPMIVGVIATQEPYCLVTQFHGINERSVTLHHAASTHMITHAECMDLFVETCSALKHVHSKGFLHNDKVK